MKGSFMGRTPTGKCYFCGKPTKLLIHQNCHAPDKKKPKLSSLTGRVFDRVIKQAKTAGEA